MNPSFSKVARRVLSASPCVWSKTPSKSFTSIISRNTSIPSNFVLKGSRHSSTSTAKLAECLQVEVSAELADDEIDQEYVDSQKQISKLFTVSDSVGEGLVTMKRQYKGESIEITFDCQDETAVDDDDDDDLEELETANEEDDEEENPKEVGTNFEVKITKANGEKLLVSMIASRNPSILGVRYLTAIQDATEPSGYGGPIFHQLNEDLQEAFYAYLQERNVDDDLSFFILSYSRVKEQTEYRNWLNSVMAFVQK